MLQLYKPEEAKTSRGLTAAAVGGLLLFGLYTLFHQLIGSFWKDPLPGIGLLLGDEFPISPRVILVTVLIVVAAFADYVLCNHPKVVEFLIETEGEMKKVSWATRQEVVGASLIVIFTVVVLGVFIFAVDQVVINVRNWSGWDRAWEWLAT